MHLKQNSVIKKLTNVHGFVCPICYKAGYKHHLVTTENQLFASHENVKKNILWKRLLYTEVTEGLPWGSTYLTACTFTAM